MAKSLINTGAGQPGTGQPKQAILASDLESVLDEPRHRFTEVRQCKDEIPVYVTQLRDSD